VQGFENSVSCANGSVEELGVRRGVEGTAGCRELEEEGGDVDGIDAVAREELGRVPGAKERHCHYEGVRLDRAGHPDSRDLPPRLKSRANRCALLSW
jgi:hypothetical protein